MVCPECGEPNADDTVRCVKCDGPLPPDTTATAGPGPTSLLAGASCFFAILATIISSLYALLLYFGSAMVFVQECVPPIWWPIPSVLAVVLGATGQRRIRRSSGWLTGLGLACVGLVLGMCNVGLGFVLVGVTLHMQSPELFLDGQVQGVSRVRTEMRSLAEAIEAYYVDNNIYPAWGIGADGPGGTWTYNYWLARQQNATAPGRLWYYERRALGRFHVYWKVPYDSPIADDLPGFALNGQPPDQRFATLTTPKHYIMSYPRDPFSPISGTTFAYWSVFPGQRDPSGKTSGKDSPTGGVGWILVSPGPDHRYDILPDDWDVYNAAVAQPSHRLLAGTNKKGRAFTYDPTNGTISHGDIWRVKQ